MFYLKKNLIYFYAKFKMNIFHIFYKTSFI